MKTIISLLLLAVIIFLFLTNPTSEEYISWYVNESLSDLPDADFDRTGDVFCSYVRRQVRRSDYLFCSVFTYRSHTTLGIGLNFIPIDALSEQAADLRSTYADWLEANAR
mgnify:CR=1 FL=1